MDILAALRQEEAMLDLADRATRLSAERRRELRKARFHIEQDFGLAVDSLLIGAEWTPESMLDASER
jgi:hypothetical protein